MPAEEMAVWIICAAWLGVAVGFWIGLRAATKWDRAHTAYWRQRAEASERVVQQIVEDAEKG